MDCDKQGLCYGSRAKPETQGVSPHVYDESESLSLMYTKLTERVLQNLVGILLESHAKFEHDEIIMTFVTLLLKPRQSI